MATFPKMSTKVVTQYPSSRRMDAGTSVMRFVDGSEQRFRTVGLRRKRWILQLHMMNEQELHEWAAFFVENAGGAGSFTFVDPWDGVEYTDCSLDMEAMEMTLLEFGRCSSTVVVRRNQV